MSASKHEFDEEDFTPLSATLACALAGVVLEICSSEKEVRYNPSELKKNMFCIIVNVLYCIIQCVVLMFCFFVWAEWANV